MDKPTQDDLGEALEFLQEAGGGLARKGGGS